jgi:hypothetical protein
MQTIKCHRCKKEWEYKGKKKIKKWPQYVSCPKCRTSVKINQNESKDAMIKEDLKCVM